MNEIIKHKPEVILTEDVPQLKKKWGRSCQKFKAKSIHARSRRTEDKGKLERFIGIVTSELVLLYYLLKNVDNFIDEYVLWYNTKRFH